MSQKNTLDSF